MYPRRNPLAKVGSWFFFLSTDDPPLDEEHDPVLPPLPRGHHRPVRALHFAVRRRQDVLAGPASKGPQEVRVAILFCL